MAVPEIIIETDIHTDVDDLGALAIAHGFAERGMAKILSIGVNTPSRFGSRAVALANAFFDRPVPVGVLLPMDDSVADHDYARFVCEQYGSLAEATSPSSAVKVHRAALAGSPDRSVTVVSLGFLGNLLALLKSEADLESPLDGADLVRRKVDRLVVMGGRFPTGNEYNISEFASVAKEAIESWPGRIDFVGWEVGAPVITGKSISRDGVENLVGAAYRQFSGAGHGRESWDPIAMHFAILGAGNLYQVSEPGTVLVDEEGSTTFIESADGRHRYVSLAAAPDVVAREIDAVLEAATRRGTSKANRA